MAAGDGRLSGGTRARKQGRRVRNVPARGAVGSLPRRNSPGLPGLPGTVATVSDEQVWVYPASARLDPYSSGSRRFLGVADANAVLSCVGNDCRKGPLWRSGLLRMTIGGAAVLYASDHVYWEIYEHLPDISRWSRVPVGVLRERFEAEYLPALRFVSVDATEIADPQVLAITDPDDVPSGQLAKLIAPCVVFSEDRHLRKPGLAPENWRAVAGFGVDLIEAAAEQYALQQGARAASLPIPVAVEFAQFLGRRTGLPTWLIGAAAVGAGAYLLRKPERRKAAGRYVMPVLDAYGARTQQAAEQERRGIQGIREVMLPASAAPSLKQQVAIVLARQAQPVLAREVQEQMLTHFAPDAVPGLAEIRKVLKDEPEFVCHERYRWQFGREAGPKR